MSVKPVSIEIFRKIPLFRYLNETELHQISAISSPHEYGAGELLIKQGAQSQMLWVVIEGQCEVVSQAAAENKAASDVFLATLDPYMHFGEMSFFNGATHSANVRAITAVKVLCIPYADFHDLVLEGATGVYKVAYNLVDSLADRLRRMDQWITDLLADHATEETSRAEWSIFREKVFKQWN